MKFICQPLVYLILLLASQVAFGQEIFVDPVKGSDSYTGEKKTPYKTLQRAVDEANSLTGSGNIKIRLFPGLYLLEDKIIINPARVLTDTTNFIIEAVNMPDDDGWSQDKMPVIKSISKDNSITQFPHTTGILVSSKNVTVRGLKFLGTNTPGVLYYYPISKEDPKLDSLTISQCYFIGDRFGAPIQAAIWSHGPGSTIENNVFFNCRNAILLFNEVNGFSIRNNLIYGAYEAAIWLGPINSEFEFENNIVTNCKYFIVRPENTFPEYTFKNSIISENEFYLGFYTGKGLVESPQNSNISEHNIVKYQKIQMVLQGHPAYPVNDLHVLPETAGSELNVGIFKKRKKY